MKRNPPRRCGRRWTLSDDRKEAANKGADNMEAASNSNSEHSPAAAAAQQQQQPRQPQPPYHGHQVQQGAQGRQWQAGRAGPTQGWQQSQSRGYFPGECHICHKKGHKAMDCPDPKAYGAPPAAAPAQQKPTAGHVPQAGSSGPSAAQGGFQHVSARTRSKGGFGAGGGNPKQCYDGSQGGIAPGWGHDTGQAGACPAGYSDPNFTPVYFPTNMIQSWMMPGGRPQVTVSAPQPVVSQHVGPQYPQAGYADDACRRNYSRNAAGSAPAVARDECAATT